MRRTVPHPRERFTELARQGDIDARSWISFCLFSGKQKGPPGGGPVHAVLGFSGASRLWFYFSTTTRRRR